jgi:uncharacterized protein (TIGR00730 family)
MKIDDAAPTSTPSASNGSTLAPAHSPLRYVCVYCGSGKGLNPKYAETAQILGRTLGERGIGLVYGGGGLGLMGEVARATIAHGGRVTGIIPEFLLNKEKALEQVNELIVTADMHERKRLMFEKSDAFIALPGGIGTLEELVEQLTWAQLGRHAKPIVVANIDGFWTPFLDLLAHMKADTFIRAGLDVRFTVVNRADQIVPAAEAGAQSAGALSEGASIALF